MFVTDLGEIIYSLAKALDLSATGIAYHHRMVTVIATAIAERMDLTDQERELLFFSSLVHDAGVTSKGELDELTVFDQPNPYSHCLEGYKIFAPSRHLRETARILLSHHDRWTGPNPSGLAGEDIPVHSAIIYLADRVAVLVEMGNGYILNRHRGIVDKISRNSGRLFSPAVVDAFTCAAAHEAFWLDLQPELLAELVQEKRPERRMRMTPDELLEIAGCFARIIDNKSPFTHHHSERVAAVAEFLAGCLGFSDYERTMVRVAGYLHDLGKIAVPAELLDKPGRLTDEEFAVIKQHAYYSYRLLKNIPGLELVAAWAPHHHEKLDGTGYPFGLGKEQIPLGSKMMAVADVFTALTEDRPYRPGFDRENCLRVLEQMADRGQLDPLVVDLVRKQYDALALLIRADCSTPGKVQPGSRR